MKLRVGIIGLGVISGNHIRNLHNHEMAEITAVCDLVGERAESKARELDAKAYTNADEMLEQERLDAVFVCVPPFAHGDIEEKAAARGIHMLVEKPQGLDMDVVRRKAEAIRRSGVICTVGYCLRYLETVAAAKSYMAGKEIAMIRAHRFGGLPGVPWFRSMAKSGGQLVEQTTHSVDTMRYLAASDAVKVYAEMSLRLMTDVPGLDIPEVGAVTMVFDSGAIGQVDTGFVAPGGNGIEIYGRDFRIVLDGFQSIRIEERAGGGKPEAVLNERYATDYSKRQDDAFLRAVAEKDPSLMLIGYEDAMKTLEITLAANESANSGMPVLLAAK